MNADKTFGVEFTEALAVFHKEMPSVKKDSSNPFFKSSYAGLDSILPAIQEPLEKAGLTFMQIPKGENELITMIIHAKTGQYIEGVYSMRPTKDDPQGHGSALTYSRRYALVAMLGLNTETDDDANGSIATKKPVKKETAHEAEFMKDLQPTDEEVIVQQEKLESAQTLKQLKEFWEMTPPMVKEKLQKVKEEMKAKLSL